MRHRRPRHVLAEGLRRPGRGGRGALAASDPAEAAPRRRAAGVAGGAGLPGRRPRGGGAEASRGPRPLPGDPLPWSARDRRPAPVPRGLLPGSPRPARPLPRGAPAAPRGGSSTPRAQARRRQSDAPPVRGSQQRRAEAERAGDQANARRRAAVALLPGAQPAEGAAFSLLAWTTLGAGGTRRQPAPPSPARSVVQAGFPVASLCQPNSRRGLRSPASTGKGKGSLGQTRPGAALTLSVADHNRAQDGVPHLLSVQCQRLRRGRWRQEMPCACPGLSLHTHSLCSEGCGPAHTGVNTVGLADGWPCLRLHCQDHPHDAVRTESRVWLMPPPEHIEDLRSEKQQG